MLPLNRLRLLQETIDVGKQQEKAQNKVPFLQVLNEYIFTYQRQKQARPWRIKKTLRHFIHVEKLRRDIRTVINRKIILSFRIVSQFGPTAHIAPPSKNIQDNLLDPEVQHRAVWLQENIREIHPQHNESQSEALGVVTLWDEKERKNGRVGNDAGKFIGFGFLRGFGLKPDWENHSDHVNELKLSKWTGKLKLEL